MCLPFPNETGCFIFQSERKRKGREKLGSEYDFRIGVKSKRREMNTLGTNDYRTFTTKFIKRKGIVWV